MKVCELRGMGGAAVELGLVTSALSQQISRLERELSTRLLQRSSTGVSPTDALITPSLCFAVVLSMSRLTSLEKRRARIKLERVEGLLRLTVAQALAGHRQKAVHVGGLAHQVV